MPFKLTFTSNIAIFIIKEITVRGNKQDAGWYHSYKDKNTDFEKIILTLLSYHIFFLSRHVRTEHYDVYKKPLI